MYTTWWANSCTIIVCCEGMHHMLIAAFWILSLLTRKISQIVVLGPYSCCRESLLGPYFIKCWVPISSQVGSLFLSLEVPKSFRNSGYLQEINLITAATTIKNSDLQKQEFQQLAKTKEIRNGDPVMHAFWALYSPLALCSIYPRHNPLFPICLQYNLCAKKWRPSCFHTYLPPSAVM